MKSTIIIILLLFVIQVHGQASQNVRTTYIGKITDKDGNPIPNIAVRFSSDKRNGLSDGNGIVELPISRQPHQIVTITINPQQGYAFYTKKHVTKYSYADEEDTIILHQVIKPKGPAPRDMHQPQKKKNIEIKTKVWPEPLNTYILNVRNTTITTQTRLNSISALGNLGVKGREAIPDLLNIVTTEKDGKLRLASFEAMRKLATSSSGYQNALLIAITDNSNDTLRITAAKGLYYFPVRINIELWQIAGSLGDSNVLVRLFSAGILAGLDSGHFKKMQDQIFEDVATVIKGADEEVFSLCIFLLNQTDQNLPRTVNEAISFKLKENSAKITGLIKSIKKLSMSKQIFAFHLAKIREYQDSYSDIEGHGYYPYNRSVNEFVETWLKLLSSNTDLQILIDLINNEQATYETISQFSMIAGKHLPLLTENMQKYNLKKLWIHDVIKKTDSTYYYIVNPYRVAELDPSYNLYDYLQIIKIVSDCNRSKSFFGQLNLFLLKNVIFNKMFLKPTYSDNSPSARKSIASIARSAIVNSPQSNLEVNALINTKLLEPEHYDTAMQLIGNLDIDDPKIFDQLISQAIEKDSRKSYDAFLLLSTLTKFTLTLPITQQLVNRILTNQDNNLSGYYQSGSGTLEYGKEYYFIAVAKLFKKHGLKYFNLKKEGHLNSKDGITLNCGKKDENCNLLREYLLAD